MTLTERKENALRNGKALYEWWGQAKPTYFGREMRVFIKIRGSRHTAYVSVRYPRTIGWRTIRWTYISSVDLSQPTIFDSKGKLKIRLLRTPKKALPRR